MIVRKVIKNLILKLARTKWEYYVTVLQFDYGKQIKRNHEGIFLKHFDALVPKEQFAFLLESYQKLKELLLVKDLNVSISLEASRCFININAMRLELQSSEDIYILTEIYIHGEYNLSSGEELNVIDIGMNVGFASLYFATFKNVKEVYSYELFTPTYNQALINLNLNPKLNKKIKAQNVGLGAENEKIELPYSYENKGRVGFEGLKLIGNEIFDEQIEKVEISCAFEVINELLNNKKEDRFLIKIDTEGAEYEILESIYKLLENVRFVAVVLEWHLKGPDEIVDRLNNLGFKTLSKNPNHRKAGMIYAFR